MLHHGGKHVTILPFSSSKHNSHILTGCYGEMRLLRKLQGKTNASCSHSQTQALVLSLLVTNIGTDSRTQIILESKGRALSIYIWSRKPSPVLGNCLRETAIGLLFSWRLAADAQVCSNYVTGKAKPVKL